MGMPFEGSADKNNLNSGLTEESSFYLSNNFSNSKSQTGIKWIFSSMTQYPSLFPSSIFCLAGRSYPSPRAIEKSFWLLRIPLFLPAFSTSLTGSAPGDKMKNIGISGSESLIHYSKISPKLNYLSISIYSKPKGRTFCTKLVKAIVILSGRIHLRTRSFKNGYYSNFLPHSKGSFYSSGANSLYHSLNLFGVSSIF